MNPDSHEPSGRDARTGRSANGIFAPLRALGPALLLGALACMLGVTAAIGADDDGMFDLGFFLWEQGDHDGARAAFQKAADSGDPRGYLELGFLLVDAGQQEDALAAFEEAAAHEVEEAWMQAGWQLARLGRVDEAEAVLTRAWELGDRVSGDVLTDVLKAIGRDREAKAIWEQTVKWAQREVSLSYRPLIARFLGEDLQEEELRAWVREERARKTPLEVAALSFDSARLAEAETRLVLAVENDDEEAARELAELYEKTGRGAKADTLRGTGRER